MKRVKIGSALVACVCLSMAVTLSAAEDSTSTASQSTQGPMIVERIKSGFLAAPDFKVSEVDRRASVLAGGYAGWVNDKTLFIGGGGYWLANSGRGRSMAYGGVVVGWLAPTDQLVGFGAKILIGGGEATLARSVPIVVLPYGHRDPAFPRPVTPPMFAPRFPIVSVRVHDGFFVAEPEANVLVNLTRTFRLAGGVGYRLVNAQRNDEDRLRGVSGSVALQIGGEF